MFRQRISEPSVSGVKTFLKALQYKSDSNQYQRRDRTLKGIVIGRSRRRNTKPSAT